MPYTICNVVGFYPFFLFLLPNLFLCHMGRIYNSSHPYPIECVLNSIPKLKSVMAGTFDQFMHMDDSPNFSEDEMNEIVTQFLHPIWGLPEGSRLKLHSCGGGMAEMFFFTDSNKKYETWKRGYTSLSIDLEVGASLWDALPYFHKDLESLEFIFRNPNPYPKPPLPGKRPIPQTPNNLVEIDEYSIPEMKTFLCFFCPAKNLFFQIV